MESQNTKKIVVAAVKKARSDAEQSDRFAKSLKSEIVRSADQYEKAANELRLIDTKERLSIRKRYTTAIMLLLFLQNLAVFTLVAYSIMIDQASNIQGILSILTAGTLGESYLVINKIVDWFTNDKEPPSTKQLGSK